MKDPRGLHTALLTPFTPDGKIKEKELAQLVRHNLRLGAHGFYVCGSTGEAMMLTAEERMEVMTIVKEEAPHAHLIAHIGSLNERDAHRLARCAHDLGYDLISSVTPFYYKFTFSEIRDYYLRLAQSSGMKMLAYYIPVMSGVNMTLDEIGAFFRDDHFAGMKFTNNDFFLLERCKTLYPDKLVYNGFDEMLFSGLVMGADGGIGSTYNFMMDKYVRLCALVKEGRVEEARAIQQECNHVTALLIRIGLMKAQKEVLNQMGMDFGVCLPPFSVCSEEEKALIRQEILPRIHPLEA